MRGKKVPLKIRAKIREEARNGVKSKEIMERYDIAKSTLYDILKEGKSSRKKRGRPTALSSAERRRMGHLVTQNPTLSSRDIAEALEDRVSSRTIQRELHRKDFRVKKIKKTQFLNPSHKEKRLAFAEKHVTWPVEQWQRVIFTDEKKFNLVGNDGYVSLWLQNRSTYTIEAEKQLRKSIMVWGAISSSGGVVLVKLDSTVNADNYIDIVKNDLLDNANVVLLDDFIFQQDNAPCHTARKTMEFLESRNLTLLPWPPLSPDLSPIENLWGIISGIVYKGGKSYQTCDSLWEAVCAAWDSVDEEVFQNLYESLPKRLIQVLRENGARIRA